jgi:quinol-cytochrome oxidoreductase complex cytochrome b subunit
MMMDRKAKAKLIILLGVIWVVITLPLPWIVNNPEVSVSQFNTILTIIGIMSIPFIVLGVVWTLKPELTT